MFESRLCRSNIVYQLVLNVIDIKSLALWEYSSRFDDFLNSLRNVVNWSKSTDIYLFLSFHFTPLWRKQYTYEKVHVFHAPNFEPLRSTTDVALEYVTLYHWMYSWFQSMKKQRERFVWLFRVVGLFSYTFLSIIYVPAVASGPIYIQPSYYWLHKVKQ